MKRVGNLLDLIETGEWTGKHVYIIGAGKDGKSSCKILLEKGIRVVNFVDEDACKWGRKFLGIGVLEPNPIDVGENTAVLLAIGALSYLDDSEVLEHPFVKQLCVPSERLWLLDRSLFIAKRLEHHFNKLHIDAEHEVLDFGLFRLPNYLKMSENIRRVFLEEAGDLILPTVFDDWSSVDEGPYVDDKFMMNPHGGDIVLDCGANIGIFSAMSAAYPGNKVYAFEPAVDSVRQLEKVQDLYSNIHVCRYALLEFNGTILMSHEMNLGQNKVTEGYQEDAVPVLSVTLDSFVKENKIPRIDFIKADIEGAERRMLVGAQWVLKEYGPKLSICTYHLEDDPTVLEKLIKEANSAYVVEHRYKKLFAYVEESSRI